MKIAYIVPSLINQGPVIVVKNLINVLISRGCDIDLFYFDNDGTMDLKITPIRIKMTDIIPFDNYDIIHSHCFRPDLYVLMHKNYIHKAKIISTLHQDTFQTFRFQYNTLISHILTDVWCSIQSRFNAIITISNQLKDSYSKRFKNIEVIYNGCNNISSQDIPDKKIVDAIELMRNENKIILGTYAYITKRKGISQSIIALSRLENYALVIIGDGPYVKSLMQLADQLNLSDRILFFSSQLNPQIYLKYIDIYLMTSYSEGFGLAMVEAALSHKAIICSDIPSFHEIFDAEEVDFFELDNIDSLISSILHISKSIFLYGENAYKKANNKFTKEIMAEKYYDYYNNLINNHQ